MYIIYSYNIIVLPYFVLRKEWGGGIFPSLYGEYRIQSINQNHGTDQVCSIVK